MTVWVYMYIICLHEVIKTSGIVIIVKSRKSVGEKVGEQREKGSKVEVRSHRDEIDM